MPDVLNRAQSQSPEIKEKEGRPMTARVVCITEGRKLDPDLKFWRDQMESSGVYDCQPDDDDIEASERARLRERQE
jgi:hypothetical protein